jgi:hypothetical protein
MLFGGSGFAAAPKEHMVILTKICFIHPVLN